MFVTFLNNIWKFICQSERDAVKEKRTSDVMLTKEPNEIRSLWWWWWQWTEVLRSLYLRALKSFTLTDGGVNASSYKYPVFVVTIHCFQQNPSTRAVSRWNALYPLFWYHCFVYDILLLRLFTEWRSIAFQFTTHTVYSAWSTCSFVRHHFLTINGFSFPIYAFF